MMPPTKSRHNRRAAMPSTASEIAAHRYKSRPIVELRHLGSGCIVWLPAKDENDAKTIKCVREGCCAMQDLMKEGYNHPVLILRVKPDGNCHFAQVTSKQAKNSRFFDRMQILPCSPTASAAPFRGNLYLENGLMHRQSYVKFEHMYEVSFAQLRACSFDHGSKPFDTRLTQQSYTWLARTFQLREEAWTSSRGLAEGHIKTPGVRASKVDSHMERLPFMQPREPAVRNIIDPGRSHFPRVPQPDELSHLLLRNQSLYEPREPTGGARVIPEHSRWPRRSTDEGYLEAGELRSCPSGHRNYRIPLCVWGICFIGVAVLLYWLYSRWSSQG